MDFMKDLEITAAAVEAERAFDAAVGTAWDLGMTWVVDLVLDHLEHVVVDAIWGRKGHLADEWAAADRWLDEAKDAALGV